MLTWPSHSRVPWSQAHRTTGGAGLANSVLEARRFRIAQPAGPRGVSAVTGPCPRSMHGAELEPAQHAGVWMP